MREADDTSLRSKTKQGNPPRETFRKFGGASTSYQHPSKHPSKIPNTHHFRSENTDTLTTYTKAPLLFFIEPLATTV